MLLDRVGVLCFLLHLISGRCLVIHGYKLLISACLFEFNEFMSEFLSSMITLCSLPVCLFALGI